MKHKGFLSKYVRASFTQLRKFVGKENLIGTTKRLEQNLSSYYLLENNCTDGTNLHSHQSYSSPVPSPNITFTPPSKSSKLNDSTYSSPSPSSASVYSSLFSFSASTESHGAAFAPDGSDCKYSAVRCEPAQPRVQGAR